MFVFYLLMVCILKDELFICARILMLKNILSHIGSLLIFGIFALMSPLYLCNIFYLIISNLRNKYEIPNNLGPPMGLQYLSIVVIILS